MLANEDILVLESRTGNKHTQVRRLTQAQRFSISDNSRLICSRRSCREARAKLSRAVCLFRMQWRPLKSCKSRISCFRLVRRSETQLASIMRRSYVVLPPPPQEYTQPQ